MRSSARALGQSDRRPALLVLIAASALVAFYYSTRADTIGVFSPDRGWSVMTLQPLPPIVHFVAAALLLAVLPVLLACRLCGLRTRELGLGFGDWRRGLLLVAVAAPAAVFAGKIGAGSPVMRAVYPLDPTLESAGFVPYALASFLYFGSWEVLFRGVLLFGLKGSFGANPANAVQTGLSVTAHFGRALNETVAALPAGLVFGWVNLRLGSIWYVAVIHWLVGVSMDHFIAVGP